MMKKMGFGFVLAVSVSSAFAAPPNSTTSPSPSPSRLEDSADYMPTVETSNHLFEQAGLQADVKDWAQNDRDVLFLQVRKNSLKDTQAKYPKLDPKKLTKLKSLMKKTPLSH